MERSLAGGDLEGRFRGEVAALARLEFSARVVLEYPALRASERAGI